MEIVLRYLYVVSVVSCKSVVKESSCNLQAEKFRALLLYDAMQNCICYADAHVITGEVIFSSPSPQPPVQ